MLPISRPLRIQFSGAVYHVINRGTARQATFLQEQDCEAFLKTLAEANVLWEVEVVANCLMSIKQTKRSGKLYRSFRPSPSSSCRRAVPLARQLRIFHQLFCQSPKPPFNTAVSWCNSFAGVDWSTSSTLCHSRHHETPITNFGRFSKRGTVTSRDEAES